MSWHYLQEQGEESWAGPSLDGAPDALLNLIPTRAACCSPASETECCPASRSGMTSPASTASPGEDTSMLSAVDSPARIFPALARGQASQASGLGFGGRWHELSVKFDRDTSSWRTHLCLFDEDLPWSSVTLPRWGMMLDGVCWERETPGPLIGGTASGYWVTPCAMDATPIKGGNLYQTETGSVRHMREDGRSSNRGLEAQVLYATPAATANQLSPSMQKHPGCRAMWPTPAATDHKGSSRPGQRRGQLTDPNMGAIKAGGQLNPTWVEWLMGWPLGWTDLKPLATDRYRSWQRSHGQY